MGLFGSRSTDIGAEAEIPDDAIKLSSWDDMCVENGGITLVILLIILTFYLVVRYHILIAGAQALREVTSPLYDHDRPNQSALRRLMVAIERIFVLPFVPVELDSYVMWIFMWFVIITIPMGVTRYYEKKWAHDLITLQGPLNMIAYYVFGCKTLGIEAIPYTKEVDEAPPRYPPPPKSEKWGRIDYFFTYHLTFGILWLIFGFIQIYRAQPGGWSPTHAANWKAHRIFGRVTILVLFVHTIIFSAMVHENPVNQHPIIIFGYVGVIYHCLYNTWQGIKNAYHAARSEGDERERAIYVKKHKMHMFFVYSRTTMGSGTIRIAAWGLWLVGHFLSPDTRMLIDRGVCQTYAEQGIGDATDCWKPVYINLMFTDLIVFWLELLFITMPNNDATADERKKKRAQFEQQIIVTFPSILFVLADPHIERWVESSSLPYFLVFILGNLAEFSAFLWWFVVHFSENIRDWLHDHVHDPLDQFYMSTIKGCLKRLYRLHDEADDEHLHED